MFFFFLDSVKNMDTLNGSQDKEGWRQMLVSKMGCKGGCADAGGGCGEQEEGGGVQAAPLCEVWLCLPVRMRPLNRMTRTDKTICV